MQGLLVEGPQGGKDTGQVEGHLGGGVGGDGREEVLCKCKVCLCVVLLVCGHPWLNDLMI